MGHTQRRIGGEMRGVFAVLLLCASTTALDDFYNRPSKYLPCVVCDSMLERLSYACTTGHPGGSNGAAGYCEKRNFFALPKRPMCLEAVERITMRTTELNKGFCEMIGRKYMGNSAFQDRLVLCTEIQCDDGGEFSGGLFSSYARDKALGFTSTPNLHSDAAAAAATA